MNVALVVPVKSFGAAKARLAPAYDPARRAELARWMATRVLTSVRSIPRYVVCDDQEVADFAQALGAGVLWMPDHGLNGAIDAAIGALAARGHDHAVIAHSDLPLARSLEGLARPGTVTLVPDRWADGTNVMAVPAGAALPAQYGPGSFRRHLAAAVARGLAVEVIADPRLAVDIDRPGDLGHPLVVEVLPR